MISCFKFLFLSILFLISIVVSGVAFIVLLPIMIIVYLYNKKLFKEEENEL